MNKISPLKYPTIHTIKEKIDTGEPYVVVFMSEWCPACQEFKPIIEFFAEKYEGEVEVYAIRPENVGNLSKILPFDQINSIPYTFFFLGKTVLAEVPGAIRFFDFKSAMKTLHNIASF